MNFLETACVFMHKAYSFLKGLLLETELSLFIFEKNDF